jgi:HEAT repeat protein
MLKPEKARKELNKVRHKQGAKRRLAALSRLPKKLADIGRGLIAEESRGKGIIGGPQRLKDRASMGARLDGLAVRERLALFEALFPALGRHVMAGWDLAHQLPYDSGFERKTFRAPHAPQLTRSVRLAWLERLLQELEGYEQDIVWLASWAGYLSHGYSADAAGLLLAGAIRAGGREGDAVFETLRDSARGTHPIGCLGQHVTRGLLAAPRPEGWEVVERLLLAAQSQEGVRPTILESINEAHPDAFRRILRVFREYDLAHFSDAIRALNVWFGFQWGAVSTRVVNRVLDRVLLFLEDAQAQARALESDDAETVYLALWTMAFEDAPAAVEPAAALLGDPNVERRFIAAYLLGQMQLPDGRAKLLDALEDTDLRVALCALEGIERDEDREDGAGSDIDPRLWEALERLVDRMPQTQTYLGAIVWPWHVFTADRQAITASLITHLAKRPPTVLIRHLPDMEAGTRRNLIARLAGLKQWDSKTRAALLALVGDASITVREAALSALAKCKISEPEAIRLEELLSRKPNDLRRGVLSLLLGQNKKAIQASADRLLASADPLQRLAGKELLQQREKRAPRRVRSRRGS